MEKSSTALVPTLVREVAFYEDILLVALVNDVSFVALRPISEFLGLDWSAQYRRTERDDVLAEEAKMVLMSGADGKQYEMYSLPLEFLPGWLFGITGSRLKTLELAAKLRRCRRECFKVLWRECKCDNSVSYFLSRFMSYPLILPAWELTLYDAQRVRNYDTELSHLHTGRLDCQSISFIPKWI